MANRRQVFRVRMADRHRRIFFLQKLRDGIPHDDGATEDDCAFPVNRNFVMMQHRHAGTRRAGEKTVFARHEPSQIGRRQPVDILIRRDFFNHRRRVNMRGKRHHHQNARHRRIAIQRMNLGNQFRFGHISGFFDEPRGNTVSFRDFFHVRSIHRRRFVLPDQENRKRWCDSFFRESRQFFRDGEAKRRRRFFSVQNHAAHLRKDP